MAASKDGGTAINMATPVTHKVPMMTGGWLEDIHDPHNWYQPYTTGTYGGRQNMPGRAVVALQPDDGGAGKVVLEAQDVVDLGAAPAVDRLVVITDAADVRRALRQQSEPQVLRNVCVLVFVDEDIAEPPVIFRQHVGMLLEETQALQ